jgi:hypothetical protein
MRDGIDQTSNARAALNGPRGQQDTKHQTPYHFNTKKGHNEGSRSGEKAFMQFNWKPEIDLISNDTWSIVSTAVTLLWW